MDEINYPSNSHKAKTSTPKEEPKKQPKIIRGAVVTRKKTFFKRLVDTFLGENINNVSSYILHDVLVPAAKDTLEDLVKGSVEVLIRGESHGGNRGRRNNGRSYVNYDRASYRNDRDPPRGKREPSDRNRSRHNFDDIILTTRGEAEEVLSHLVDLTIDYDMASIADLYDMVGIESTYVDRKYGWTHLNNAVVSRVREGYLIDLPPAKPLD